MERPPEVVEMAAAVRKTRSGRAGGPSGMKAEHLKAWLRLENQGERSGCRDVRQSDKCHTGSVLGWIYPGGLDVDNNGPVREG